MDNLNERELRRSGAKNALVPNMHLAFMTVGYDCPFVGEQLKNSGLRNRYGVSISSIQRGNNTIMVPGADARIFPGDILGVIGTDEEIQALLPVVEASEENDNASPHDDIRLTSIRLTENSPLIDRTLLTSGLRDKYESLLVAVQTDSVYNQPDPARKFNPGDVLWLVGDTKRLSSLS